MILLLTTMASAAGGVDHNVSSEFTILLLTTMASAAGGGNHKDSNELSR